MLLTTGSNTAIAGSGLRLHGALQEARALHACGGGGSVQVLSQYSLGNGASWWNLAGWEQEPAGPGGTRGQCAAGHGPGCLGFLEAFSLTQRAAFLHQLPGRPPSPLRSLPWWLPWPGPVLSALHVPSHPTLGQAAQQGSPLCWTAWRGCARDGQRVFIEAPGHHLRSLRAIAMRNGMTSA